MLSEIFRHPFGHRLDRNARSVRADNRPRLAMLVYARKEVALDLQLFNYSFDDPVGFSYFRKIVFKVARANEAGDGGRKERCWLDFLRCCKPRVHYAISHLAALKL
jgi:hypothetical protein